MPREWLIQHRAGTLAEWAAAEASGPVLLAGERAYITDLKLDVVGDGVTKVASLGAVGSGTYAPLGVFGGNLSAVLGDSTANYGDGIAYWIAAVSKQRFSFPNSSYVKSFPGQTTAYVRTQVPTVTGLARKPRYCFVLVGSNDAALQTTPAQFMTNLVGIFTDLRAAGITPVAVTAPPRTGIFGLIAEYNFRMVRYAVAAGIPVLDQWSTVIMPGTEQYQAAYSDGDSIHPSSAGMRAIATRAAVDLAGLSSASPDLAGLAMGGINLCLGAGHLTDSATAGVAAGYAVTPASGFAYSRVADAAGNGWSWQRVTLTSTGANRQVLGPWTIFGQESTTVSSSASAGATSLVVAGAVTTGGAHYKVTKPDGTYEIIRASSSTGSGPYTLTLSALTPLKMAHSAGDTVTPVAAVGDTLAMAVKVRSGQAASYLVPQFTFYTTGQGSVTRNIVLTSPNSIYGFRSQLDDGLLYAETTLPANTAGVQFGFQVGPEDGTYDFALPLLCNVTRMS